MIAFGPEASQPETLGRGAQALADMIHLAPMMLVAVWSLLQLLADAFSDPGTRKFERRVALTGLGFAAVAAALQLGDVQYDAGVEVFSGFLIVDPMSILLDLTVLAITAGTVMFAGDFARSHRFEYGEQEALLLIAAFGVMILNHAGTLLALFLGIETMSIAVYVMVGARWNSGRSSEAALKYFIMGAFSSGLLVMGIALLYGATGTMDLAELSQRVSPLFSGKGSWGAAMTDIVSLHLGQAAHPDAARDRAIVALAPVALFIPGVLLVVAALLFKVSAVPFHMWTPDAYDGAPTPTTAFMAAAVKLGGFAALLKFLVGTLQTARLVHHPYGWATVVGILAIVTMTVGNVAAIRQKNVKRLLAYSSVAHVGYLLVGIVAAAFFYVDRAGGQLTEVDQVLWSRGNGDLAVASVLYYLVTYGVATMGTFACVAFYGAHKKEATSLHQWAGMAQRHPGIALSMTICLLSLMGMPPIAGFFGKLGLFRVAMTSGDALLRWMVIFGVLNSVVGAAYYLRIIVTMYFRPPLQGEDEVEVLEGHGARVVVVVAAALSVLAGVGARPLLDACRVAAAGTGYRAGSPTRLERVTAVRDAIAARGEDAPEAEEAAEAEEATGAEPADDAAPADVPEGEAPEKPEGEAPEKPEGEAPEKLEGEAPEKLEGDAPAEPAPQKPAKPSEPPRP
ncbi:MAG: proton-conducting transporter membrane subunit [Nannocystaceae bacterium]|nr:hypothetical protein [bacterium]